MMFIRKCKCSEAGGITNETQVSGKVSKRKIEKDACKIGRQVPRSSDDGRPLL